MKEELRRLSVSEPMYMAGCRNGFDTWSKSSELRGRGVAQNVGLWRRRNLLQLVMRKNSWRRFQRVALIKVEHPGKSSSMQAGCGQPPSGGQLRLSLGLWRGNGEGAAG